jgi:glucose/arabinose dehydrogenase
MRLHTLALIIGAASLAACAGSADDAAPTGPDVTLGTVPTPTDAPTPTAVDPTVTTPVAGDDADPSGTPSTSLVASPGEDLPTNAPGQADEPAPVTTLPGPLPEPSARAIELASFTRPVEATGAPGDNRLFVVQQTGQVIAVDDESNNVVLDMTTLEATTFTSDGNEQGLLGLAFHPETDFAYVDFTNGAGNTVIAEFLVDPATAQFDPATYREVLTVEQPFGNHNGGEITFGPDGYLYIGLGDGGSADDPNGSSLDLSSRLGKILRIDPFATDLESFTVPPDNPFVGVDGVDPAIWSVGLRNPWKFSFDSLTGDLWIGDVGQNVFEEIDLAPAVNGENAGRGLDFGWSAFEADERFNEDQVSESHTRPVVSYVHEDGNCSVSGGAVARNSSFTDLNGWYVYGDYCSGRVWALDTTSVTSGPDGPVGEPRIVELLSVPALAAVVEGPFGDIHLVSNAGTVYRLAPA